MGNPLDSVTAHGSLFKICNFAALMGHNSFSLVQGQREPNGRTEGRNSGIITPCIFGTSRQGNTIDVTQGEYPVSHFFHRPVGLGTESVAGRIPAIFAS
jgi:hypothetical protein